MFTIQRCFNFVCPGVLCYLNCTGVLWLTVFSRTILLTNGMFHVSNHGQGLPWSAVDLLFISQSLALSYHRVWPSVSTFFRGRIHLVALLTFSKDQEFFKDRILVLLFFIINSVVAVNIEINSEAITSKFIWPYCLESFC